MGTQKLTDAIEDVRRLNEEQGFRNTMFEVYRASANRIVLRIEKTYPSKTSQEACQSILHDALSGSIRLNPVDRVQLGLILRYFETGHAFRIPKTSKNRNYPRHEQFKECHSDFLYWLTENGKSRYTIESYRNVVAQFLNHLSDVGCRKITSLHPRYINSFFKQLTTTWAVTSVRVASSAIRSFLTYLDVEPTFMHVLPKHCPKHCPIIPVLSNEEDLLLKVYFQDGTASYKSKSIIALCYFLGIRAIDIINLQLRDIDWNKDLISFFQSKTGESVVLPLIPVVGNCLAHYIAEERQESLFQNVFLREVAPICPFSEHSAVYCHVARAFKKLHIRKHERQGSHLLRHNLAMKQISCGTSIGTISTLLGHSNIETTNIYLSTDYEGMRQCCIEPIYKLGRMPR
ncbi:MAG: tyrosine-type recombinase/integrase [Sphaerochaetaceae bacterium]|nr:tyrosine-type recombinase/integrase [Sphaerochaetaceae bacterium]